MELQRHCLGALVLLLVLPNHHRLSADATTCSFPAIFNFGDSNSDTGGLAAALVGVLPPPYGITFFHKSAGRYSDGRLAIDFIAQQLGLSYLDAYLQSIGSNFKRGANFATAASTIRPQSNDLGYSPFSLDVQVTQFEEFKLRTLAYYTKEPYSTLLPEPGYFQKALYTLDIGQNDLTALFDVNLTVNQVEAEIPQVVQAFSTDVKALYQQGARNFLIIDTGPLGCLPYILTGLPYTPSQVDAYGCAEPYNNVAKFYNKQLESTVNELKKDLPAAIFVLVDGYNLKHSLFVNAHNDGFQFTVKACCGFGGGLYNFNRTVRCGENMTVDGTQLTYNVCQDPSVYVNWDGVHYTEAANHRIANGFFSGNFSSPSFPAGHFCDLYAGH